MAQVTELLGLKGQNPVKGLDRSIRGISAMPYFHLLFFSLLKVGLNLTLKKPINLKNNTIISYLHRKSGQSLIETEFLIGIPFKAFLIRGNL